MADKNQSIIDLLKRVDREGFVVLPPVVMTPDESELIGSAVFVNPDQPLMHYMKFEFFMQMLVAEQLRMRRLDDFRDDPIEGLYPEANKHELSSFDVAWLKQIGTSQDVSGLVASNKHQREEAYIHCWFGGISESKPMWEKHGDKGRGVCLTTTAGKLEHSVKCSADLLISVCGVTCLDEETPIPTAMSFLPFCRKRTKFKDENEFRLIAEVTPEALPLDADGYFVELEKTRQVPVNLEMLLETVVTGPNLDKSEIAKLEAVIGKKFPKNILRSSQLPGWSVNL